MEASHQPASLVMKKTAHRWKTPHNRDGSNQWVISPEKKTLNIRLTGHVGENYFQHPSPRDIFFQKTLAIPENIV